jgi:hypothetical protein
MYRIELSPGEETAFRSIEELAVAIRRNVVTSRARIYHNATGRWLPIQFHPHYKQAVSMPLSQADLVAGPPVAPLSALNLGETQTPSAPSTREAATQAALAAWPEPKPAAPRSTPAVAPEAAKPASPSPSPITLGTPAPEPRRVFRPLAAPAPALRAPEPPRRVEPSTAAEPRRTKRSGKKKAKRTLRIALAGAILIACAHLVVSGGSSDDELAERPRIPRQLIQLPSEALRDITPRTVAAVLPALQSIPVPGLNTPKSAAAAVSVPMVSRTMASRPTLVAPAIDSTPAAPAPAIEAAPDAAELGATAPVHPEPVTAQVVDSSRKKALKGILRTIGGTSAPETKSKKQ